MTFSLKRIRERVAYQTFNLHLTFAYRTHQVFSHRAESERINTIIARNPVMPLQVRNKDSMWFFQSTPFLLGWVAEKVHGHGLLTATRGTRAAEPAMCSALRRTIQRSETRRLGASRSASRRTISFW